MHLQFSTASLPNLPLRSSFATAQALQLSGLELALTPLLLRRGPEPILRLAARYKLVIRSVDLSPLGELAIETALIPRLVGFITALPGCQVVALPIPNDWSLLPGGLNGLLNVLTTYSRALGTQITLTLINAPGRSTESPGPLDRFPQLRRIIEEWELGYTFDTSHAASAGWVITEPLPSMGGRLRNVHLSDFRPELPQQHPMTPTPLLPTNVQPWQLGRRPGEGVLPLRAFLRTLRRREYRGLVTVRLQETGISSWWPPRTKNQLVNATIFCRTALDSYQPRQSRLFFHALPNPTTSAEAENEEHHATEQ